MNFWGPETRIENDEAETYSSRQKSGRKSESVEATNDLTSLYPFNYSAS